MNQKNKYEIRILNALNKVFPDDDEKDFIDYKTQSVFKNETASFQIAYREKYAKERQAKRWFKVRVVCPNGCTSKVYSIGLVPSELPAYNNHDDNYLRTEPGLYPDLLKPLNDDDLIYMQPYFWRALWIDIIPDENSRGEFQEIRILLIGEDEILIDEIKTGINIIDAKLPEQELIHTEWIHYDCLSDYYHVDIFSEAHWDLIEKYIKTAVEYSINMVLTPLFTPPLDTKVGGERPTVQLIDVTFQNGRYKFDFGKLEKWITMCRTCGVEYFEMSHLFTQWGAKHTPKIMAFKDGEYRQIFGWDTDAGSPEYKQFLDEFLPQLMGELDELKISERCYFHISDEPNITHLESYKAAKNVVQKHLKDFKIFDALSDIEFYKMGLVENPIPATNHIESFLESGIGDLWTYYCCGQDRYVSNRFMAMPSARNRTIGIQLFKYDIKGFLHWGFNFWNSQFSRRTIDPFMVTDADCAYPSGDPFLVYPGEQGPLLSVRIKVFRQAIFDLRAMKLLESLQSKEFVLNLMETDPDKPISFSQYPSEAGYVLETREKINNAIISSIGK